MAVVVEGAHKALHLKSNALCRSNYSNITVWITVYELLIFQIGTAFSRKPQKEPAEMVPLGWHSVSSGESKGNRLTWDLKWETSVETKGQKSDSDPDGIKNLHLYNQQREIPVFDEDPLQFSIY